MVCNAGTTAVHQCFIQGLSGEQYPNPFQFTIAPTGTTTTCYNNAASATPSTTSYFGSFFTTLTTGSGSSCCGCPDNGGTLNGCSQSAPFCVVVAASGTTFNGGVCTPMSGTLFGSIIGVYQSPSGGGGGTYGTICGCLK
jgi:hypothetical protein